MLTPKMQLITKAFDFCFQILNKSQFVTAASLLKFILRKLLYLSQCLYLLKLNLDKILSQ